MTFNVIVNVIVTLYSAFSCSRIKIYRKKKKNYTCASTLLFLTPKR